MAVIDPTSNYNWNLPNNLADDGAWGAMLRVILGDDVTGIDAILKAVSDVADAALSRSGGSMTGEIGVKTERFVGGNLGNMSGTVTLNLATANCFFGTVTGPVTFQFSNVPASGDFVFVTLEITNGGSQTINWPASVKWPGGSPPDLTDIGVDVITLYTRDGGVTWHAAVAMLDV